MADEATNDAATQQGTSGDATDGASKTFTQDQVDRIVQDRLARAKATPPADYEDLKAKAAKFDELEQSQKTEIEKAMERASAAERERDQALLQAQEQTLRTAIIGAAAGKLADPSDAVALIDRSAVEFGKDGSPTNVGELVSSLLEAKPHLAASGGARGTSADQGARGTKAGQITREQLRTMTADQITAAQASGQLDHLLRPGG